MTDRTLLTAFAVSAVCHALLLAAQAARLWQLPLEAAPPALNVVYERPTEEPSGAAQLQRAVSAGGRQASPGLLGAAPRVRVAERSIGLSSLPGHQTALPQSVVDLTNIVEAAQGDPVLLSYFGAIRERIQRAANQRNWLAGELAQGLVYVQFSLGADGRVDGVSVAQDRSTGPPRLRDAAANIIKAAGPFPAFPPSMTESRKTVVVPLEFLVSP